jgi:kinesin family protein 6/9
VSLEASEEGSSVIRRSKLHLVDLAGSERTGKTQSTGTLFREATHINKSLHYLELVIVALHEARRGGPGRSHIPYRNSLMTSVLRDSLGGNCRTTMIATINPEGEHTDESISTCRFAQRVARVTNCAVVNEALDPLVLSKQLKVRVSALEAELALARGLEAGGEGSVQPPLSEEALHIQNAWDSFGISAFVGALLVVWCVFPWTDVSSFDHMVTVYSTGFTMLLWGTTGLWHVYKLYLYKQTGATTARRAPDYRLVSLPDDSIALAVVIYERG